MGVEIQEVTPDLAQSFGLPRPEGALVASADKDGPAGKGGIERGDIVLSFNGHPVDDEHELPALVAQTPINQKVPVEVVRNGKHMTLEVTIGERKEPQVASAKTEEPGGNWGMQAADITPEDRAAVSSRRHQRRGDSEGRAGQPFGGGGPSAG